MFDGRQVVDTESLHYYGNSLGGILGDVYMAVTTDVIRGQSLLLFPGTTAASVLLFIQHVVFGTFCKQKSNIHTKYTLKIQQRFILFG